MDCTEFKRYLTNYENLTDKEKSDMDNHASECELCATELTEYIDMLSALRSLPKLETPDDFIDSLNAKLDIIDAEKKFGIWKYLKTYSCRYGAVAACLALVAVIGFNNNSLIDTMLRNANSVEDEYVVISEIEEYEVDSTAVPSASPKDNISVPTQQPATVTQKPAGLETQKPSATAVPQTRNTNNISTSKETVHNVSTPTLSPTKEQMPKDNTSVTATAPPADTESKNESTASVPVVASNMVPEDDSNQPAVDENNLNPDEYSLPDMPDTRSIDDNETVVSSYSNINQNSIEVSLENADKAREIIAEYSVANDGEYYSINSDQLEELLQAMNSAGVDYDENCTYQESDTVTFRLIIS